MIEAHRSAQPGAPALTPNAVKAMLQFTRFRCATPAAATTTC